MFLLIVLLAVLNSVILPQSSHATISGKVIRFDDKSPLANSNIFIKENLSSEEQFSTGTITDSLGKFKINLPYGHYTLTASYVGYKTHEEKFSLSGENNSIEIIIELKSTALLGEEVTVTGNRKQPSTVIQEIEKKDLERMPTIYNDVLRAVQILPGVTTNSELSSGYNVRGGNFDDNLIYLNGFEIYRPFLLRQGIEENKSLINPDLVEEFRFYNGSFPASYGDKMSSALEVNYNIKNTDTLAGYAKVDFLSAGLTLKNKIGEMKIAAAFRYAYPGLFLNELQTSGDYRPSFKDVQLVANYPLSAKDNIEILLLYADNKFDLTPTDWEGHFGGFMRGDVRGLDIYYNGVRNYSFRTGLAGIKYSSLLNSNTHLKLSAARYNTIEDEYSNVSSEFYYLPDTENKSIREFIKSANENVSNNLDLTSYEFIPEIKLKKDDHLFTAGLNIRLTDLKNKVDESFSENSDTLLYDLPFNRFINENFKLNSYSAFLQDEIKLSEGMFLNAGIRSNYYVYNKEFLFSPRATITYILSAIHNFILSWGYYYQPPYYSELRNKDADSPKLKAQRSIHYSAGWEYQFKEKVKLNVEAYYKDLDNIIPYYIDREKTEYLNENSNDGFSHGFDLMVQGEIVEGINSWLGYGYLNTKERTKLPDGSYTSYRRRLPDQTHSLQVFLQDKIKKHPNWQSHFRLLFGSGFLYNLKETVTDPETGIKYLNSSADKTDEFFIYFRVDMGLSANFDINNSQNLIVIAEVFNLFNHNNYGGYRFVQVSAERPDGINSLTTFAIPQVLSKRFFNVSLELRF
jgi:outer membrane receptor for ferrienterochelin and colicin